MYQQKKSMAIWLYTISRNIKQFLYQVLDVTILIQIWMLCGFINNAL